MSKHVTMHIDTQITLEGAPAKVRKWIKTNLSMNNPKYAEAVKHGRYVDDIPPVLRFWVSDDRDLTFPRGFGYHVLNHLKKLNIPVKIVNNLFAAPDESFTFTGVLRDYQQEATKSMLTSNMGVLDASTGSGKTVMGLYIIAQRQQPTLVVVHTKELLNQWASRAKEFLGVDVGLIGGGKFSIKPLTIGIVNTLRNRSGELQNMFGHVIVDENHRVPSTTFTSVLLEFNPKYILGLSATQYRRDGLTNLIYWYLGPKMHRCDPDKLRKAGAVLTPEIIRRPTGFDMVYEQDDPPPYSTIVKELTKCDARNHMIALDVYGEVKASRAPALVVSDRVAHCKDLTERLQAMGVKAVTLSSATPKREREQIVTDMLNNKIHALVATLQLIGEGFDAKGLSSVFLTTPIRYEGRVIQVVGRVLRPKKGKKPKVFDYRDTNIPPMRNSGFHRDRVYKSQNW